MRKIIAAEYVSLDGVMENPAWTGPYFNPEISQAQNELLFASEALLLGRVTYESMSQAWLSRSGADAFTDRINSLPKYVVSATLTEPTWNASFLKGDFMEEIRQLKAQPGQNLLVYGSADLLNALHQCGLVDEYHLIVAPVTVGQGKRLFAEGGERGKLQLLNTRPTSTGMVILTYGRETAAEYAPLDPKADEVG